MSQATAGAVRAGAGAAVKPPAKAPGKAGPAGPRLLKLLAAIMLVPVVVIMLIGLHDLNFGALIWNHPDPRPVNSPGLLGWRTLTSTLPGLLGLFGLGLTLGLAFKPATWPERLLQKIGRKRLGGPDGNGRFLARWLLLQMPLWTLIGCATQVVLRLCQQPLAADGVLTALPFTYGLYAAWLMQEVQLDSEVCQQEGFFFVWISTAAMQMLWLAVGLVFFLQANSVGGFLYEWGEAVVMRGVQLAR